MASNGTGTPTTIRCAIYTRKSTEEGLKQDFNSLDAQRDAATAYIRSQVGEGWKLLPEFYDDGGFTGANMLRPALRRLLADVEAKKVDCVVVYKVDRLSRSIRDFAKIMDTLEKSGATFVSVTQQFNTTTSLGRLTLNILLSFAQFEREVIGERIRDKVAASRKRGMWMGGVVPLGYEVRDRKLAINDAEAVTVRMMFAQFVQIGSATLLAKKLSSEGVRSRRGRPIDKGFLYKLLSNRIYIGDTVHKGTAYPGEHAAIIDHDLWNKVHTILQQSPRQRASNTRTQAPALLKGIIFTETGAAMTPTATKKGSRLYRYYTSMDLIRNRATGENAGPQRLPAGMIEAAVVGEIQRMVRAPEVAARTIEALRTEDGSVDERAVISALASFDQLWASLFPAEQARIVQLLVERVTIGTNGVAVDLRNDGLGSIVRDMITPRNEVQA